MKDKELRLHPEAEQEYLASLAWYRGHSPVAAEEFAVAVREAIDRIRQAPQRWPFYVENFRKYTLRQFPFSIIYEELLTEVAVYAIAHGSRRPGYWMSRV